LRPAATGHHDLFAEAIPRSAHAGVERVFFPTVLPVVVLLAAMPPPSGTADWPRFRGPGARGVAEHAGLPDRWSATENVAWKTDIPGRGWSSPIVRDQRVFLTTVVGEGDANPDKGKVEGGAAFPNHRQATTSERQWKVLCLDLGSGQVLWERLVHQGPPPAPTHVKNSYASETPVADGERVYACFGNVGVVCLDFEGRPVWSQPIPPHAMQYDAGTAASPVLHGDRLYLVNDNQEQSYLLALDKRTGRALWRVERDEQSNWCTPYVWEHDQRSELVTSGSGKVRAYDLDGKLLWWFAGMSGITIATPYADQGLLYLSSGFLHDQHRPLYAIRPGAAGDISLQPGQTSNASIAWYHPTAAPYHPTTLVYQGRLYVLYDRGRLSVFDPRTGSPLFENERLSKGAMQCWASPWAYSGRVFCLNEDGVTFVVQAGEQFRLLHVNRLADDDMCLATPAIAGDRLLIRTSARIYCLRNRIGQLTD
jgi:outer membrane protein assembly factor BamB